MFSSGEVGTCVGCYGKCLPTRALCCRDCVPLVVHTGAKLREALPGQRAPGCLGGRPAQGKFLHLLWRDWQSCVCRGVACVSQSRLASWLRDPGRKLGPMPWIFDGYSGCYQDHNSITTKKHTVHMKYILVVSQH